LILPAGKLFSILNFLKINFVLKIGGVVFFMHTVFESLVSSQPGPHSSPLLQIVAAQVSNANSLPPPLVLGMSAGRRRTRRGDECGPLA
jgi:hypothetical protein